MRGGTPSPPDSRMERRRKVMPHTEDAVFPYSPDAIAAAFTRACKLLGIEDLHSHDLRHEGVSRLFEMGWSIPRVAGLSGHRSWQSLKRYTHLRQVGDKYLGWNWLTSLVHKENVIYTPAGLSNCGSGHANRVSGYIMVKLLRRNSSAPKLYGTADAKHGFRSAHSYLVHGVFS